MSKTVISFKDRAGELYRKDPEILQVNLGRLCNLSCVHCHVEAGPTRTEDNMNKETAEEVVRCLDEIAVTTLDLTGGAPEMNPHFRYLVREADKRGIHVIDRCNLTILLEKEYADLAQFLTEHKVEVVASLPCYSEANVDKQRGGGTFDKSIEALKLLNSLGYAKKGGPLLNLVYNPVGPHLPPEQVKLEQDYKLRLSEDFGIYFNKLYTITNMPIKRYEKYLKAFGQLQDYRQLLHDSYNAATLDQLMCRNTVSIGWDGAVYDCDFNQMMGLAAGDDKLYLKDLSSRTLAEIPIRTADHCYGCTAGSGSSCQGSLA